MLKITHFINFCLVCLELFVCLPYQYKSAMKTMLNTYIGKFALETAEVEVTTGSSSVRNLSSSNRKRRAAAKVERIEEAIKSQAILWARCSGREERRISQRAERRAKR